MHVRTIQPADRVKLIELTRANALELRPHLPFDSRVVDDNIDIALAGDDFGCLVAEHEGRLVGYLVAFVSQYLFNDLSFASLEVIYVERASRGTSAAARLLRGYDQWARARDVAEIYVGTSAGQIDDLTLRWFERLGYHSVGGYLRKIEIPAAAAPAERAVNG